MVVDTQVEYLALVNGIQMIEPTSRYSWSKDIKEEDAQRSGNFCRGSLTNTVIIGGNGYYMSLRLLYGTVSLITTQAFAKDSRLRR
jgi:hypothetical protein